MEEITEGQLRKVREAIPFTPTERLKRDDVLYVTEEDIPHPIIGYAEYHKEYSVIDLRGYRKGYEPRLEISGIYTPDPEDIFRLQTGKLPPYQPTTTGDKLLAEMRRLGVHKAFRIGEPEVEPEEVPAVSESMRIAPELEERITRLVPPLKRPQQGEIWEVALRDIPEGLGEELYKLRPPKSESMLNFGIRLKDGKTYRLDFPLGGLLPKIVVQEVSPMSVIEYDYRYSLEELREMARQAGLSPSGSKKEIAARLIARGVK